MISAALPHTELLESIKIETGYTNIRNLENKLKILATDAEKKLGYNSVMVTKKISYNNDGLNFDGKSIWLPTDCWEFTALYDDGVEIDLKSFYVRGNFIYFVKGKEPKSPTLVYEALTFDGHGWPLMSRNHKDAITAYIVWKLYVPKAFQSGNRSERLLAKDYEQDWNDERDAAIGNDVMPGSQQEWNQVMSTWSKNMLELSNSSDCILKECAYALEAKEECVLREVEKTMNVYTWQLPDTVTDIAIAPTIDLSYLSDNATKYPLADFLEGRTVAYNTIGRIAFAIEGISENEYEIFDTLNDSVDEVVFNKYYNESLKLHIYISKEFYSISNIFFKVKKR
tara:strand:- start:59429 stop:60448 length:1020 start_codon:yes stop_codon:yes gene_type:complete